MLSTDAYATLAPYAVAYSVNGIDMNSATYDAYTHVTGFNSEASVGNLKAILSAVNHMYDIKGETISFDPRTLNYDTFEVSGNTSTFMYIIFVGIIPLAILLACIFICVRRRHL